jgi:hypothetical protein
VDYAVPAFFERGRRFWKGADGPTLCAKASMASLPVITALQRAFGINADVANVLHACHRLLGTLGDLSLEPVIKQRLAVVARACSWRVIWTLIRTCGVKYYVGREDRTTLTPRGIHRGVRAN